MVDLEPSRSAVVLLDLQNEVIHQDGRFGSRGVAAHALGRDLVAHAVRLTDAARRAGTPVVHIHHRRSVGSSGVADSGQNASAWREMTAADALGSEWATAPYAGLEPHEGDTLLLKQRIGGFVGTPLDIKLRALGVRSVLVGGALTNFSVESTLRSGADLGYEMVLAENACASFDEDWHRAAVNFAIPMIAEVASVDELVAALAGPSPSVSQ